MIWMYIFGAFALFYAVASVYIVMGCMDKSEKLLKRIDAFVDSFKKLQKKEKKVKK